MPPKKPGTGGLSKAKAKEAELANAAKGGNAKASSKTVAASQDKKPGKGGTSSQSVMEEQPVSERQPTIQERLGCKGWTGKLPVTLLNELCQKSKWKNPEYIVRRHSEGYFCAVRLARQHPKTQELETVEFSPSFDLNPFKPTNLEAKHWGATFALHRVNNMKNTHLMLPPPFKSLWSEFEEARKKDIKEKGWAWKYAADPFTAKREHEIEEAAKKKAIEEKKVSNSSIKIQGVPGGKTSWGANRKTPKSWENAPVVDLNRAARNLVEKLVQRYHVWNPLGIEMSSKEKQKAIEDLIALGFRKSHAEESCEWAKDKDEALEWLLIHVPEDDLPESFMPENYNTGVSIGGELPLAQEYAAKRLAETGFSLEICRDVLIRNGGQESRAAEALMQILVHGKQLLEEDDSESLLLDEVETDEVWVEEYATIDAIWGGERLQTKSKEDFRLQLDPRRASLHLPPLVYLRFRRPKTSQYPDSIPVITVEWEGQPKLPAHVRLSIVRQCAHYAWNNLRGEHMILSIVDWAEEHLPDIVENPGKLREVSSAVMGIRSIDDNEESDKTGIRPKRVKPPINWKPGSATSREILDRHKRKAFDERYDKMKRTRMALPAWQMRETIVKEVENSQVTIISGETGSGKSTQAVQFILDNFIEKELGEVVNIICTQPRRISALGLAERVSGERCEVIGDEVGYAIRGESKQKPGRTKITFVTTGVLLRRLQMGDNLADVSHIVIDEVHERSLDTDFLLVLLKRLIKTRRDLRVILMSATLDAQLFADYFGKNVGIINIPGRTYPVKDYYLDDVIRLSGYDAVDLGASSNGDDGYDEGTGKIGTIIRGLGNGINYQLIAQCVSALDKELRTKDDLGSILIFLPGTMEIARCINAIVKLNGADELFYVLPLHASLTSADQKRVFAQPPYGRRKVIATTNVAETSITIDDAVAVIDTGRVKETEYDPATRVVRLIEKWASRAACKQRRGRAGRVRPGICWKLYTRNQEEFKMEERPLPEMKRVPLEQTCLSILGMGASSDVREFLASALTPPEVVAVEEALVTLERMGATDKHVLTALGRHLAMIPADLRCAKLMVYGSTFGLLDASVTISAIMTTKSPFVSPLEKRQEAKAAKLSFASPSAGDLLAAYNAFTAWSELRKSASTREVRNWCDLNFLSHMTLMDIQSNRANYLSTLQDLGFLPYPPAPIPESLNRNNDNESLLRALIAGAFMPQISRVELPDKKYMQLASGAVSVDPEARTIKFFGEKVGRVFLHPSSTLFDSQTFSEDMVFLSYAQLSSSGKQVQAQGQGNYGPKTFLVDVTPVAALPLLLFGPSVKVDALGRGITVDNWIRLRGWGRIGVLLGRLRWLLDGVLKQRIDKPGWELGDTAKEFIESVTALITWNGKLQA